MFNFFGGCGCACNGRTEDEIVVQKRAETLPMTKAGFEEPLGLGDSEGSTRPLASKSIDTGLPSPASEQLTATPASEQPTATPEARSSSCSSSASSFEETPRRHSDVMQFMDEYGLVPEVGKLDASVLSGPLCISDLASDDGAIVFVSDSFLELSGYSYEEVIGRNCRFLQGADTDASAVQKLSALVKARRFGKVRLLNYAKCGKTFENDLVLVPLLGRDGERRYMMGGQCDVKSLGMLDTFSEATTNVPLSLADTSDQASSSSSHLKLTASGQRPVRANEGVIEVDNEWLTFKFRMASRTEPMQGAPWASKCLEGTKRQVCGLAEIVLKKSLDDYDVYAGGYVPSAMPLGYGTKMCCKMLLKMVEMWESSFHASFGSGEEKPHIVLRFEPRCSWTSDHLEIRELQTDRLLSPKEWPERLQPGYRYNLEIGSPNIDLEHWRLVNLPLGGTYPLKTFWGNMPMHMVMYAMPRGHTGPHKQSEMVCLFDTKIEVDKEM
eukprot:TRINITY_DN36737_c1_g2_i1.p1 TRINITY_DN36737_c1_g2~~TRINITY_DN36737_c1_g2_i1.p1  ORF type:complete len:496 (+),score=117.26 TRINITY_DN36737_c1_g2_i1:103-1590(+)